MKVKEIKALRAKYDYSQQDCAKLLGMSRPTYSKKENGTKEFTFDEVVTLLRNWNEVDKINDLIN